MYNSLQNSYILVFFILCVSSFLTIDKLYPDIRITGQNEARYARGELPDSGEYNYFQNYLELTASMDNLRIYSRQSYLLPSEFDNRWQSGIVAFDKRYIEYRKSNFRIRGGDFYRNWGRGLLLGTVEFIDLNFDSGLDGVLVETSHGSFSMQGFRGVEVDTTDRIVEAAEGVYVSYVVPYGVRIGGSYAHLDSTIKHPALDRSGIEIEGDFGPASLYAVYSSDKLDTSPIDYHHGFYGSLIVYGENWGVLLDYKNYRLLTYGGKLGQTPLQFVPTAVPEVTMYLLDHHPKQPHFGNDVGWQLEITRSISYWTLKLNMNQTSEHEGNSLLPVMSEEYSPYTGVFANLEYDDYEKTRYVLQGGYHEDIEFTTTALGGYSNWFRRIGFGGLYESRFTGNLSGSVDMQVMFVDEVKRNRTYIDEFIAFTFSRSPDITATILLERTENSKDVGGLTSPDWITRGANGRIWPGIEVTYNFTGNNQLRLFTGHERGGLKCSGGICRWVNPFQGVKFTFTSQF